VYNLETEEGNLKKDKNMDYRQRSLQQGKEKEIK
jgi:hypothetical protein